MHRRGLPVPNYHPRRACMLWWSWLLWPPRSGRSGEFFNLYIHSALRLISRVVASANLGWGNNCLSLLHPPHGVFVFVSLIIRYYWLPISSDLVLLLKMHVLPSDFGFLLLWCCQKSLSETTCGSQQGSRTCIIVYFCIDVAGWSLRIRIGSNLGNQDIWIIAHFLSHQPSFNSYKMEAARNTACEIDFLTRYALWGSIHGLSSSENLIKAPC